MLFVVVLINEHDDDNDDYDVLVVTEPPVPSVGMYTSRLFSIELN